MGNASSVSTSAKPQSEESISPHEGIGRRERRAAETRLKLFRAAIDLFAERGFSNVTVSEITEQADVGKGTFFNYFPTKDHVLCVMAEIQLGKIRAATVQGESQDQSIHSILHDVTLGLAEEPGRSPGLARAVVSSFLASDVVRELLDKELSQGRGMVGDLVAKGQQSGEIDPRLKKDVVARQFQQSVMGTILLWSLHDTLPLKKRIEETFLHFWRAIAIQGRETAR